MGTAQAQLFTTTTAFWCQGFNGFLLFLLSNIVCSRWIHPSMAGASGMTFVHITSIYRTNTICLLPLLSSHSIVVRAWCASSSHALPHRRRKYCPPCHSASFASSTKLRQSISAEPRVCHHATRFAWFSRQSTTSHRALSSEPPVRRNITRAA